MSDWSDDQPIYVQLRDRLLNMILDGEVQEGEAIPSVRQISLDLKINPITVSKAVAELEAYGALEKRRGLGMFVKTGARDELRVQAREQFLQREWPQIAARIARLNLSVEELITGVNHGA